MAIDFPENPFYFYAVRMPSIAPSREALTDPGKLQKVFDLARALNDHKFTGALKKKPADKIKAYLDQQLEIYLDAGGDKLKWIEHTVKRKPTFEDVDRSYAFSTWIKANREAPKDIVNVPLQPVSLNLIFELPEYYELCLKIYNELSEGKPLTKGKGYILFAVIDSIAMHTAHKLLIKTYLDDDLLSMFNNELSPSHSFKQIKRNSPGYKDSLKNAKEIIDFHFQK